MQQSCTYGSVRGASGNRRPYRDKRGLAADEPLMVGKPATLNDEKGLDPGNWGRKM